MIEHNKSSSQIIPSFSQSKNLFLAIALAIFILAFSARVIPGPRTIDDAFKEFKCLEKMRESEAGICSNFKEVKNYQLQ